MGETPQARQRPAIHPVPLGAGLIFIHGLFGAFLSSFLTVLKFRSAYSCDIALLSSCRIGSAFNCESVLNSAWSTFPGDIPISIYASSFFLVIAGLSGSILLWPRQLAPAGRSLLLVLAWSAIAAIVPLFTYALFLGLCSYCLVIYIISIIVLLAAMIMNRRGLSSAISALRDGGTHRRTSTLLITGLTFLACTLVQIVWFLQERSSVEAEEQCVTETGELPETTFIIGPESPEVEVALFFDLSCSACRREYTTWKQEVRASGDKYQLKLYHFPLEGDCVAGLSTFSARSELNHSCNAARAVECIERRQKGLGLKFIDLLFERQDGSTPYFSLERLAETADEVGFHVNPSDRDDPFIKCVLDDKNDDESQAVLRRIQGHTRFAVSHGFHETPAIFLVFYEGGVRLPYVYKMAGDKNFADLDEYIQSAKEAASRKAAGEEVEDD